MEFVYTILIGQNPAAYGQFTTIPTPPKPIHIKHINNGLKKLDDLKDELSSESKAVKESYDKLFGPAGTCHHYNYYY